MLKRILVIVFGVMCLWALLSFSLVFLLRPSSEELEKKAEQEVLSAWKQLKNCKVSQIGIRYAYKPQNLPQQIISFTIESPKFEKELKESFRVKEFLPDKKKEILSLQNSFRVSSSGDHNYSLDSDFQICSYRDPYFWWYFNFFGKNKLLLTYNSKSYLLEMEDDSLYNLIFEEALTYNKNLFKNVLGSENIYLDSSL